MFGKYKIFKIILVGAVGVMSLFLISNYSNIPLNGIKNLASVFFVNSTTSKQLINDYAQAKETSKKINILIMPGHDMGKGGTEFRGLKERDLNIKMAEILTNLLRKNKEFNVILTRNEYTYNLEIQKYLKKNKKSIQKFIEKHKETMGNLVKSGLVDTRKGVEHNNAPSDTVMRLYGINKWANDNNIDLVVHVHFNDYPGRRYNRVGKYSGFTIYVPEHQFSNAEASKDVSSKVFKQLNKYFASSNLPAEKSGVVEDQELIAVGSFNTLDPAVFLIEYGYLYESQFINSNTRITALREMAKQTYLGIVDFFENKSIAKTNTKNTAILSYSWGSNLKRGVHGSRDVYALQVALSMKSFYPPITRSKNDCPINGNFGPCTQRAVINFQKKYGIKPASGFVGPITRLELNKLFLKSIFFR